MSEAPSRGQVLIVEDDPVIRETIGMILEREGLSIRSAADGEEALSLARELVPDVVFLDLTMPGLDGLEVLRELKGDPATATAQVVIVSTRHQGREEAMRSGADEFFVKPFSPLALLRIVERLLPKLEPGEPHEPPAWPAE